MTLPTIRTGTIQHPEGKNHYAEFRPDGMMHPVRLYGISEDEVTAAAFEFLEEHDRERRHMNLDLGAMDELKKISDSAIITRSRLISEGFSPEAAESIVVAGFLIEAKS